MRILRGVGFIQTRVGRRVLVLFIVCALVPIAALGLATYRSVGSQLREQAQVRAYDSSKRIGLALLVRLDQLATTLAAASSTPARWESLDPQLGALALEHASGIRYIRGGVVVPVLDERQRRQVSRGQPLLVVMPGPAGARLLLAYRADSGAVLWAEPPLESVTRQIGAEENARQGSNVCVFAPPALPIYCPVHVAGLAGGALAPSLSQALGSFEWTDSENASHLAGYWSLFLAHGYGADEWRVVYSEATSVVYGPLLDFTRTFPIAAGLALLVIALLSNFEIRRTLGPLAALRRGTERVARRQFDEPVQVNSNDEFKDLADAFNTMTGRLRSQFSDAEVLAVALQDASDAVRGREAELRAVLDSATDGIVVVSTDNRIVSFNHQAERQFGLAGAEAVGLDLSALIGIKVGGSGVLRGDAAEGAVLQVTARRRNGTSFPAEAGIGRARHGERVFYTVFVRDVSDRFRAQRERELLEAQLRQAQKMETIGTLAGGIAHDFNNILTPIMTTVELVLADAPLDDTTRADLGHVAQAANRARDLVRQILTFSRRTEHVMAPVQVGALVKESLKLLRSSLPATIEIRSRIAEDLPPIDGDATQLHQVIMNLCTNAAHAMKDEPGVLDIEVGRAQAAEALVSLHPRLAGRCLSLSIRDSGCGMDPRTLERIFEPFFTTKAPGEGTGLGMSIVHGIVTAHGGAITAESDVGVGTRFIILLPAGTVSGAAPTVEQREIRRGAGRVLVVDDDAVIAALAARVLKRVGFATESVTSPEAALELVKSAPGAFDLVITDQAMPGMKGQELARRLRLAGFKGPMLLMSGYADAAGDSVNELFAGILPKPMDIASLSAAVSRAIEQARAGAELVAAA